MHTYMCLKFKSMYLDIYIYTFTLYIYSLVLANHIGRGMRNTARSEMAGAYEAGTSTESGTSGPTYKFGVKAVP